MTLDGSILGIHSGGALLGVFSERACLIVEIYVQKANQGTDDSLCRIGTSQ